MSEKFNKNTKVEQLTKVFLSRGEEKDLTVKDPYLYCKERVAKHLNCGARLTGIDSWSRRYNFRDWLSLAFKSGY